MSNKIFYNTQESIDHIQDSLMKRLTDKSNCLHLSCPNCHGTGINKINGSRCIHMIACPCPRCSVWC